MLTSPLRDRFGVIERLEFYTTEELALIVERSARVMGVRIDPGGVNEIAGRARGTPRIANRLLRRVRDYAEVRGDGRISRELAREALQLYDIDENGLDRTDRRILLTIMNKFDGGPVGVETLAAATAEEVGTIEDVYEPYLMQLGLIQRTPRRVLTDLGYRYFGMPPEISDRAGFCVREDQDVDTSAIGRLLVTMGIFDRYRPVFAIRGGFAPGRLPGT